MKAKLEVFTALRCLSLPCDGASLLKGISLFISEIPPVLESAKVFSCNDHTRPESMAAIVDPSVRGALLSSSLRRHEPSLNVLISPADLHMSATHMDSQHSWRAYTNTRDGLFTTIMEWLANGSPRAL